MGKITVPDHVRKEMARDLASLLGNGYVEDYYEQAAGDLEWVYRQGYAEAMKTRLGKIEVPPEKAKTLLIAILKGENPSAVLHYLSGLFRRLNVLHPRFLEMLFETAGERRRKRLLEQRTRRTLDQAKTFTERVHADLRVPPPLRTQALRFLGNLIELEGLRRSVESD